MEAQQFGGSVLLGCMHNPIVVPFSTPIFNHERQYIDGSNESITRALILGIYLIDLGAFLCKFTKFEWLLVDE